MAKVSFTTKDGKRVNFNTKKSKRKVYKDRKSNVSMAKRRRSRSRSFRRGRSRSSGTSLNKVLIGSALVLGYELYVRNKIPLQPQMLGIAELAVGAFTFKKSGLVGDFGKVLLPVSLITFGSSLLAGSSMGGSSTTAYY